jgi:hypothetical protein
VLCGLQAPCSNHELVDVEVKAGESVKADPTDWKTLPGSLPPFPLP